MEHAWSTKLEQVPIVYRSGLHINSQLYLRNKKVVFLDSLSKINRRNCVKSINTFQALTWKSKSRKCVPKALVNSVYDAYKNEAEVTKDGNFAGTMNIENTAVTEEAEDMPEKGSKKENHVEKYGVQPLKWPLWLLAPSMLLATGVIPTLWLPFSSILSGSSVASLLSLTGLDGIFNIGDKNSVTWNKGKISAEGSRAVGEAYFRQFQKDFSAFLEARAKELVAGGRMVLLFMGRTSPDPNGQCMLSISWELLESGLNDLVSQGLIEQEKVDSFNMPVFCPCCEEVNSEIAREGSFEIQRLELLTKAATDEVETEVMDAMRGSAAEREAYGKSYARRLRAVTESLLKYHFGEEVMDTLLKRCGETLANRLSKIEEFEIQGGYLVMVLERKSNSQQFAR